MIQGETAHKVPEDLMEVRGPLAPMALQVGAPRIMRNTVYQSTIHSSLIYHYRELKSLQCVTSSCRGLQGTEVKLTGIVLSWTCHMVFSVHCSIWQSSQRSVLVSVPYHAHLFNYFEWLKSTLQPVMSGF